MKITVFTPTFNRGYTLKKCYESLKIQTYHNFEWLIYDDGSTDNTKEVIEEFIKEGIIEIRYYYAKNRGKHFAINQGTDLAHGELFFIVDSDDYLTKNSLELVYEAWDSVPMTEREKFIGVSGRRYLVNKDNKEFNFSTKYYDTDAITFNLIDNNLQDKAEVYVTNILRQYKFPYFEGENFMTEAVLWYQLAEEGYKIRWFNEDIYICEYLKDGLSANFYKKRIESIHSTCDSYNKLSSYKVPKKYKIRYKINYFRYGLNNFSLIELVKGLQNQDYRLTSIIAGYIMYLNDKRMKRA